MKQLFGGKKRMANKVGWVGTFGLSIVLGLVLLAGCTGPTGQASPPSVTPTTEASASQVAPTPATTSPAPTPVVTQTAITFPITITDQLGRTVTIKKMPQRIVSIAPSDTEILFALGLGDKVVGVDQYSDFPPEAKTKTNLGGYTNPSIEKIISLNPDLIMVTSVHQAKVIPVLESLGFTVVGLDPKTVDEVLDSITLVGKITGAQAKAAEVVTGMSDRIKAVTDKTASLTSAQRPRVFYVVWSAPLMSCGNGTFQADLIQKAGGANVAQGLSGWATISLETVVAANPEVLITDDQSMAGGGANFQFISTKPELANTAARKNGLVFTVNNELISHPGPRLVDALEQFAKLIHPELFK